MITENHIIKQQTPMYESGYYPAGAEHDPRAPWNEELPEERNFNVEYTAYVRKVATCATQNYNDVDEKETDWDEVYRENHYTLKELLERLQRYIEDDIANKSCRYARAKRLMLEDCKEWIIEDENYEQV